MAPRDRLESIKRGVAAGSPSGGTSRSEIQTELEKSLDQAVKEGKIPHAVVHATNADGSFEYHYQTGIHGKDEDEEEPVLMLASLTKLMTSIAALQAVEQGLFTLDQDISPLIPEISKNGVLQGFTEEGKAIVEERKNPITLRQLITHASGATYPTFHPWTLKHQTQRGIDPLGQNNAATVTERHDAAMVFQPGEGWMYSPGLDWYGLLLQRKTKGQYDLESWMREFLWKPLGISPAEITFWPDEAMKRKIPPLMVRNSEGKLCPNTADTINTLSTECFGGHGAYAKLSAYTKILRSLLADDGTLLRRTTVREMFRPQLGDASRAALNGFMQRTVALLPGDLDPEIPVTYGLGGMLFEAGEVDRRLKGTMNWSGLFNCFWILDREAGIAYTFGTQVLPPGDAGCKEMEGIAERAVYKMAGVF